MRCEDFPCCGHELGQCPNEDGSFNCVCGARLPKHSRSSLCETCLNTPGPEDDPRDFEEREYHDDCDNCGSADDTEYDRASKSTLCSSCRGEVLT